MISLLTSQKYNDAITYFGVITPCMLSSMEKLVRREVMLSAEHLTLGIIWAHQISLLESQLLPHYLSTLFSYEIERLSLWLVYL